MRIEIHRLSHQTRRALVTVITICFLAVLLGACATGADKADKLDRTLRGYEKALRWAKFDMAYSFHKWEESEQPSVPQYLKSIRITSYDIVNRAFDGKAMTAKQNVTIKFYNQNDLRERTLEEKQNWKYFPKEKRWYLTSKPPSFQ